MKIIPFPGGEHELDAVEIAALEAAVSGGQAPGAGAWRELGADIRALAPSIDGEFEASLHQRLAAPHEAPENAAGAARGRRKWRRWTSVPPARRVLSLGGAGAMVALVIAVIIVSSPSGPASRPPAGAPASGSARSSAAVKPGTAEPSSTHGPAVSAGTAANAPAVSAATPVPAPAPGPASGSDTGRVQQLGASLTLAGSPEEVQKLADGVSRIVIAEGGFVSSSQVQVERGATNSATLLVSVPSARLSQTLAALGRLGPVRAETQSLQDITSTYDSARSALAEAVAERGALLRALAHAVTQGEIESLHRRLAIVGGTIERDRAAFAHVAGQAANASLEVDVLGEAHPAGGGLTLRRGLHDAGRVLTVALAVLLIGLAALVPLLAVGLILGLTARALRRAARERALGGS